MKILPVLNHGYDLVVIDGQAYSLRNCHVMIVDKTDTAQKIRAKVNGK